MSNLEQKLKDFIDEWSKGAEDAVKDELSWTKNLKNSVSVESDKNEIRLVMPGYAVFVEYGRKPGKQPPLAAISEWANSRKIRFNDIGGTGRFIKNKQRDFLIARSIGEKGLPAKPFMFVFDDKLGDLDVGIADIMMDYIGDEIEN